MLRRTLTAVVVTAKGGVAAFRSDPDPTSNMFSDAEKKVVRRSWNLAVPTAEMAADFFYRRLFQLEPEYRALFPEDLTGSKRAFARALAFVVQALDWEEPSWREDAKPEEDLLLLALALGRRHAELYRVREGSYANICAAVLAALEDSLGSAFDAETRETWSRLLATLTRAMQMGSASIDRDAAQAAVEELSRLGEEALRSQRAAAGVDVGNPWLGQEAR